MGGLRWDGARGVGCRGVGGVPWVDRGVSRGGWSRGCLDSPMGRAATFEVTAGKWPSEVGWSLACDGGVARGGGGAPFFGNLSLDPGVGCALTMTDSYADGWNGAEWVGLGQRLSLRRS